MMDHPQFDSDQWLSMEKDTLVNLMFQNELGVSDFRNTSVIINFEDLQSPELIKRFDRYRKALRAFLAPMKSDHFSIIIIWIKIKNHSLISSNNY